MAVSFAYRPHPPEPQRPRDVWIPDLPFTVPRPVFEDLGHHVPVAPRGEAQRAQGVDLFPLVTHRFGFDRGRLLVRTHDSNAIEQSVFADSFTTSTKSGRAARNGPPSVAIMDEFKTAYVQARDAHYAAHAKLAALMDPPPVYEDNKEAIEAAVKEYRGTLDAWLKAGRSIR